jgi:hypothetical protein
MNCFLTFIFRQLVTAALYAWAVAIKGMSSAGIVDADPLQWEKVKPFMLVAIVGGLCNPNPANTTARKRLASTLGTHDVKKTK